MAIEGNLNDMSLPSIVQIMCLERHKVGVHLARDGERGCILFDTGEIVHATIGAIEGEEAIYQLLTWEDGAFRTSRETNSARRTIYMRWDQLLMEGMRRLDESTREIPSAQNGSVPDAKSSTHTFARALSRAEIEEDGALESDLLMLLSHLEHARAKLSDNEARRRPSVALQLLAEMVNRIVETFTQIVTDAVEMTLREVISKQTSQNDAAVRLLTAINNNRLASHTLIKNYESTGGMFRARNFADFSRCLLGAMKTYFNALTARLHSTAARSEMDEAARLFLTDLTGGVAAIQG